MQERKTRHITDKRIIKTRKAVHAALWTILSTKALSEVTITEVCEIAEVNRKTFYMYYNTPTDVFNESLENFAGRLKDCLEEFSKEMNILSPQLIFALVNPLIQSDDHIKGLVDSPNTALLYEKLVKLFTEIYLSEMNKDFSLSKLNRQAKEIVAGLFAGSTVTLYFQYAQNPKEKNLDEISNILSTFMAAGLQGLANYC